MSKRPQGPVPMIRGSGLWARLEWVRENYGTNGLEKLKSELPAAGRNLIYEPVARTGWYNLALFLAVGTAIDKLWGKGDQTLNIELARWSCHRNMPALYSMFIRLGSVGWVLNKASRLFENLLSPGSFTVTYDTDARYAEGKVDYPMPHLAFCYSSLGFAIGCVELSGEKNVRGHLLSCRAMGGEDCVIRVEWGE